MPTKLEKERMERFKKIEDRFEFVVTNRMPKGIPSVESTMPSLDSVLHKVKMDISTLSNYSDFHDAVIEIRLKLKEDDNE